MKRITSIVFDFGNVITLPQDKGPVAAMAAALGGSTVEALEAAYAEGRGAYDRGDIGPAEYWAGVGSGWASAWTEPSFPSSSGWTWKAGST